MDIDILMLHIFSFIILVFFSFFVKETDEDEGIKFILLEIRNFVFSLMFRLFILCLMLILLIRIISAIIELFIS